MEILFNNYPSIQRINGDYRNKDIVSADQFDVDSIAMLFKYAQEVTKPIYDNALHGNLAGRVVNLFFEEASTRTKTSFKVSTYQMGGFPDDFGDPSTSSAMAKGESLRHTIMTLERGCDLMVMRSKNAFDTYAAAEYATRIQIMSGGDGPNEHPTQGLLDLATINQRLGRMSDLTGVIGGDPAKARTIRSLLKFLALYPNNKVQILAKNGFKLPSADVADYRNRGLSVTEIEDPEEISSNIDYFYWTRPQSERDEQGKSRNPQDVFRLDREFLKRYANPQSIILHPLPANQELGIEVDDDPRAVYFSEQIPQGYYIRMALLEAVMGDIS